MLKHLDASWHLDACWVILFIWAFENLNQILASLHYIVTVHSKVRWNVLQQTPTVL